MKTGYTNRYNLFFLAGIISGKYFHVFFFQTKQTNYSIDLNNDKNASLQKWGDSLFGGKYN